MTSDGRGAAPGWYPTPDGQQRYWDGQRWTDHFAPTADGSAAGSSPGIKGTDDPAATANYAASGSSSTSTAVAGRPWFKKKRWWAVGALAFFGIAGALGSDDQPTVTAGTPTETSVTSEAEPTPSETTPPETTTSEPTAEITTVEPEPEPEPVEPELSVSQQQAIRSAEDYLDYTAFSRSGLITQLEFEGFSAEEATFAVDNITVDRNEQAAKSAEQYLEYTSFSRSGLITQLEFEGFTREQATFGADAVGL
jgi:colicin import membrane protein